MKKPKYNSKGTKQIVESNWKLFNQQTNFITTGNVVANTQYSNYIRPWKETECNGHSNPCGHLMDFDLNGFKEYGIPERILEIIKDKNRTNSVVLYMFFVSENESIKPFCWLLTDYNHNYITHAVVIKYGAHFDKRVSAAKEAISYICDMPEDDTFTTVDDKELLENIIKSIEARHSPELLNIMESALKEYLTRRYGRLDEEKYDRLLNLYASRLYQALTDPMYSDAGITLK